MAKQVEMGGSVVVVKEVGLRLGRVERVGPGIECSFKAECYSK